MTLKRCSIVTLVLAIWFGVLGIVSAFAGDSNIVTINGYQVAPGDELIATVYLGEHDKLISGYLGIIQYDSDCLEIKEVLNAPNEAVYNKDIEDKFKFAATDAIDGMDFSERQEVIKISFLVKESNVESTDIKYNFSDIYEFDKKTLTDTKIENINDITIMQLQYKLNTVPSAGPGESNQGTGNENGENNDSITDSSQKDEADTEDGSTFDKDDAQNSEEITDNNSNAEDSNETDNNSNTEDNNETDNNSNTEGSNETADNSSVNSDKKPSVNIERENPRVDIDNDEDNADSPSVNTAGSVDNGTEDNNYVQDSNSQSQNYETIQEEEIPNISISGQGEIVDDNTAYTEGNTSIVDTGDKFSLKTKIYIIIASLLGCFTVGGFIKSSKNNNTSSYVTAYNTNRYRYGNSNGYNNGYRSNNGYNNRRYY